MTTKTLYTILLLMIGMTLHGESESIPLPTDEQAHKQLAQELRAKIEEEISRAKSIQNDRASEFFRQVNQEHDFPEEMRRKVTLQSNSINEKANDPLEDIKVSLPEDEKDKYAVPTF